MRIKHQLQQDYVDDFINAGLTKEMSILWKRVHYSPGQKTVRSDDLGICS